MYNALLYKYRLWKLQRDKGRARGLYRSRIAVAKKKGMPQEEINSLISDELFHVEELDDRIVRMQVQFLSGQAEKYLIPIPRFNKEDGSWELHRRMGHWRWSQDTILRMKAAIRDEHKYRREYWQSWVTLSVGVIGALTGLVFGLVALVK